MVHLADFESPRHGRFCVCIDVLGADGVESVADFLESFGISAFEEADGKMDELSWGAIPGDVMLGGSRICFYGCRINGFDLAEFFGEKFEEGLGGNRCRVVELEMRHGSSVSALSQKKNDPPNLLSDSAGVALSSVT